MLNFLIYDGINFTFIPPRYWVIKGKRHYELHKITRKKGLQFRLFNKRF